MTLEFKKLRSIFLVVTCATILFATSAYASGLLSNQSVTPTTGVIANANLGLYKDRSCTQNLTSINWGTIYPASNVTATMYIHNQGTVNVTLQKATSNWNPSTASNYLSLNWNYTGQTIKPADTLHVTFTLAVSPNINSISTFSFNINVTSSG
jgi:hypothetical protein